MKTEAEQLRAQLAALQREYRDFQRDYLTFAGQVRSQAHSIAACCVAGLSEKAGVEALTLCQQAGTLQQQMQMQQESSGESRYDLTGLVVFADAPSNSETGWEREE